MLRLEKTMYSYKVLLSILCGFLVCPISNNHDVAKTKVDNNSFINIKDRDNDYIRETPKDLGQIGNPDYVKIEDYDHCQETSFEIVSYFSNLYEYQASNDVGSCGFVSLCEVLSYYDTFHNDSIIPEAYDRSLSTCLSESEVKQHSPGIIRESYIENQNYTYYDFCHDTMEYNLQSRLTVLNNQLRNTDNNGSHLDGGQAIANFNTSIGGWSYNNLLSEFYSNTPNISFSVTEINNYSEEQYTQNQLLNLTKAFIYSGYPVIVEVKQLGSNGVFGGYHSVVAYEVLDETVYANYGWGSYLTHTPLLNNPQGYNFIEGIYIVSFRSSLHTHSNNYRFGTKSYCGCNLDDTITIKYQPMFTNLPPTIHWMKNGFDETEFYRISIKGAGSDIELVSFMADKNEATLSINQWNTLMESSFLSFEFYLRRFNNNLDYLYGFNKTTFYKSNDALSTLSIAPIGLLFPDSYCSSEVETQRQIGELTFLTRRLRTGFIQYETINLSPRRENAGLAYLELEFTVDIYMIELDISFWGPHEFTNSSNATGYIQFKNSSGDYVNIIDLYNDISLSTDRTNQNHIYLVLPEKTNIIRFYTTAEAIGNTNRGRISIGSFVFYYDL